MSRLNWSRIALGVVIAAVIMFVTDGLLHENLVNSDWNAVYARLDIPEPHHDSSGMVYFVIFEIGRAFIAIFLYALMRSFYGAGVKTAVLAGIIGWIAFSVTGPAQFMPLGFYSTALWLKVAAAQLVTSIIATIAGAAPYKDPS